MTRKTSYSPKQAKQRYWRVFIPSMSLYLLTTLLGRYLIDHTEWPFTANIGLALMPALCILWFIWGHGRWIMETDEYQRHREMRAIMVGVGVTLAFCSVWGFMEMFLDAPKFPIFYVIIVFCAGYGLTNCLGSFIGNRTPQMDRRS